MGKIRHASLDRSLPPMSEFSHKRKTLRIQEEELRINEKELYYRILSIDRGDSRWELEGETY
jgi:hypothetical protein